MYPFFYSLYLALFSGSWQLYTDAEARSALASAWEEISNWLMNLFGGHFATIQSFTWSVAPENIWSIVLAILTMSGVCFAVLKIIKRIFGIFFDGWR